MDELDGCMTSVEEVTADVERARDLQLDVMPEDMTELMHSHYTNLTDEELLLTDEQKSGFLRWNLLLGQML
jgi:hypothetical protein